MFRTIHNSSKWTIARRTARNPRTGLRQPRRGFGPHYHFLNQASVFLGRQLESMQRALPADQRSPASHFHKGLGAVTASGPPLETGEARIGNRNSPRWLDRAPVISDPMRIGGSGLGGLTEHAGELFGGECAGGSDTRFEEALAPEREANRLHILRSPNECRHDGRTAVAALAIPIGP